MSNTPIASAPPAVQLGYPCDKLPWAQDVDVYLDKIGGRPVWFSEDTLPPKQWSFCESCQAPLLLIAQMLGQLPGKQADRVYYVFGCNRRECMTRPGSWRVIKALKSYEPKPKKSKGRSKKEGKKPAEGTETSNNTKVSDQNNKKPSPKSTPAKGKGARDSPVTPLKQKVMPQLPFSPPQTPKFNQDNSVVPSTKDDEWNAPIASDTWSLPATPSFGDPKITPLSFSPSPSLSSVSSPTPNLAELLALRDKKYAWDDEKDVETEGTIPVKIKNAENTSLRPLNDEEIEENDLVTDSGIDSTSNNIHPGADAPVMDDSEDPVTALSAQFEESLAITDLAEATTAWSRAPTFSAYPLEFAPEPGNDASFEHEMRLLASYKQLEKDLGGADGTDSLTWSGEGYEKVRPKYYNKAFKRFQRIVEEEPEQCIRYAFNGQPVFYRDDDISESLQSKGPPPCSRCNGPRVFEFQLMPMILSLLPTEQLVPRRASGDAKGGAGGKATNLSSFLERYAAGMDWGTVLVYSCARDCEERKQRDSNVSYSEEYIVVQVESLV
ncbi:uncharacterized protein SPPG_00555 [Spizellomyces punctatus DAOM BR117]|uniref:Programmed cell death protein 2 C-terminal domain-containing protein n=1 Tax=Spizellomyces punctatus (strain DAOM BR117) TaxID=645134 RepID=A0A0L0HVD2_SPIPD|nr:uncharacterized protein SPPG_00555 [Spizellomyces punctatus DAOM BR117]KND04855.1 hypothetical protein SPPG_00555 [Spizellomyces punctatus DAOM BR117]|eukprot:XP_016612894.1 hypothetical protein SPPG_00555 [Spizellomyces punctatus DAOM BR117]